MPTDRQLITVSFTLKRKVGIDEITLEQSAIVPQGDSGMMYNHLFETAKTALDDYYNNVASTLPKQPNRNAVIESEWFKIERLTVDMHNGTRLVKAKGGLYRKHGLTIWPEIAETIGLKLDLIHESGYIPLKLLEGKAVTKADGTVKLDALRIRD